MDQLERVQRQLLLRQAEGYLELGMPQHALDSLAPLIALPTAPHLAFYLQGEGLREQEKFAEAVTWLRRAAEEMPSHLQVWLALGWCYKRLDRIDLSIESLQEALEVAPGEAIVHYNLACYWSLARNKRQALLHLGRAFEIDGSYREKAAEESDFDPIRADATFQRMTSLIA